MTQDADHAGRGSCLALLQSKIGHEFRDLGLLDQALRHRSVVGQAALDSYERLEFLGDAVIGCIVAHELYTNYPLQSEGFLAQAKAFLVSEPVLARAAARWDLGTALLLDRHAEPSGIRARPSVLSDSFEAVVGAVYLDAGYDTAAGRVRLALADDFQTVECGELPRDPKSELQEVLQAVGRPGPTYREVSACGEAHDRTFTVEAVDGALVLGTGSGRSKKSAEQAAAAGALVALAEDTRAQQTST